MSLSSSVPTDPTVKPIPSSRNEKLFCEPVTRAANSGTALASGNETGPAAEISRLPPANVPAICRICSRRLQADADISGIDILSSNSHPSS